MSTLSKAMAAGRQRGITLVELVIFIVVVGIAVAGVLLVMNLTTRHSADPLLRKQALAIAEALLEEVELMPFTTCDPDGYDAAADTCALAESMGPEPAYANQSQPETRGSGVAPFDNVNDYNGFVLTGGESDLGNSANVVVPPGYTATVAIAQDGAFGPAGAQLPAAAALRITVTVAFDGGNVVLEGYRAGYQPTAIP